MFFVVCIISLFFQLSHSNVYDACDTEQFLQKSSYIAAVVEYQPVGTPWDFPPDELIQKNADNYKKLIEEGSYSNADIIVFPEYGLTTLGIPKTREDAKPYLLIVPETGINPCDSQLGSQVVQELSCSAKANSIYVVVNLGEIRPCISDSEQISPCPEDGRFQFNTNVAFDRNGTIVAKYEKANLYFEDQFDKPSPIQLSRFYTDFGVEFGLFTCFDIIFYQPALNLVSRGIRNFVFPTAWVDELPFLTAIQSQASWAFSQNVNLLASGYHQPLGGQLGSGIYSGEFGALNYTFDPDSGTKMVIAEVPVELNGFSPVLKSNDEKSEKPERARIGTFATYRNFLREDLQNYTTSVLKLSNEVSNETVCTKNGFCCHLEYQFGDWNSTSNQNYRLISFNGTRTVAAKTDEYDWQVCGVIRCSNETLESCSENDEDLAEINLPNFVGFKLHSRFDSTIDQVSLPGINTLDVAWNLIPYEFFGTENKFEDGTYYMQISSTYLGSLDIKTIAMINKLYDIKKH